MRSWFAFNIVVLLAVSPGCQRLSDGEDDPINPSGGGAESSGTFLPQDDSNDDDDDDDAADESGGAPGACNPTSQVGCEQDEKCTAIVSGGEVTYACAADMPMLDPTDPCSAAHDSGLDGCPAGFVCLEDEGGNGLCAELCLNSAECTQGECMPARETDIPYCADDCSPFGAGCPAPLACRRNGDRFSCQFIGSSDVGGDGSPCAIADDAGCAPGLVCVPGALIPGCTSDNCCSGLCDVSEDNPCASPSTCNPILTGAAPGFEDVGACFVPA